MSLAQIVPDAPEKAQTTFASLPSYRHNRAQCRMFAHEMIFLMEPSPSRDLVVTLTSLWSAMLGGALGAAVGGSIGPMVCSAAFGLVGGFIFSVLVYLPLVGGMQAIALFVIGSDFEGQAIGCAASDRLSALLGAVAGAVGAVVVAALPDEYDLFAPESFVICWTVAAFVPIIISFALAMIARRKNL